MVFVVAALLAGFGSPWGAVTETVFVRVPAEIGVTVIWTVAEPLEFNVPKSQDTTAPAL